MTRKARRSNVRTLTVLDTDEVLQAVNNVVDPELAEYMLKKGLSPKGAHFYITNGRKISDEVIRLKYYRGVLYYHATGSNDLLQAAFLYKSTPVSIREFIRGSRYLKRAPNDIHEPIVEELEKICAKPYKEVVLTGSIGSCKSSIALLLLGYHVYLTSLLTDPHATYSVAKTDEIVYIFQNLNARSAKAVDYTRFKTLIDTSVYFPNEFPYDKKVESQLNFPNNIKVIPMSGEATASIGQNIVGGLIDEVNFMEVTDKSKKGRGKTYDQAWSLYNSINMRRKSRFRLDQGLPGILCLASSRNYPGQFTDIKEKERADQIAATGESDIYLYDKRAWEILPFKYPGPRFNVFIGDLSRQPRIMREGEILPDEDKELVLEVPEVFREDFQRDPISSLRDVGGLSTLAKNPFLPNREAVTFCFGRKPSVLSGDATDFETELVSILPKRIKNTEAYRYVHADLAISGDSCGLSMGYVSHFTEVQTYGTRTLMPVIDLDFILEVKAPPSGEINYGRIRGLLIKLIEIGVPIKWMSLDMFQSVDTIQIMRQYGLITGKQSVHADPLVYDVVKTAFLDKRLRLPYHAKCQREVLSLERDPKNGKVNHPEVAGGSDDVIDSVAGVVYGLTYRSEVWAQHGVRPSTIEYSDAKSNLIKKTTQIGDKDPLKGAD